MDELNAREELAAAADWLGWSHEDLSCGLKSAEDGLKLWRHGRTRETDEYPDEWPSSELVGVLGYDPIARERDRALAELAADQASAAGRTRTG